MTIFSLPAATIDPFLLHAWLDPDKAALLLRSAAGLKVAVAGPHIHLSCVEVRKDAPHCEVGGEGAKQADVHPVLHTDDVDKHLPAGVRAYCPGQAMTWDT